MFLCMFGMQGWTLHFNPLTMIASNSIRVRFKPEDFRVMKYPWCRHITD